jgi:signal transduction histidine kinase
MLRFFSVLSHDLKSPIFSVDGFSDLLLADYQDKLDADGVDFLRRIRSSAQQMKRLLDDFAHILKLLSRAPQRQKTDVSEIVEELRLKYNYLIDEGGVKLEISQQLPTLSVDREMFKEMIGAILSNALTFTDRAAGERTVAIDFDQIGSNARICIRDNGIGFEQRYADQIFDLGVKLDKSRGGGPGYGLYLAKRVAEIHGGELTVQSARDQGSTFCVTLPSA